MSLNVGMPLLGSSGHSQRGRQAILPKSCAAHRVIVVCLRRFGWAERGGRGGNLSMGTGSWRRRSRKGVIVLCGRCRALGHACAAARSWQSIFRNWRDVARALGGTQPAAGAVCDKYSTRTEHSSSMRLMVWQRSPSRESGNGAAAG
jgi:hypothetical protein